MFQTDFSVNNGGFKYADDTFRDTNQPDYAAGRRVRKRGGYLGIWLGGIDNKEIWDMSGSWSRHIQLPPETRVVCITFTYSLNLASTFGEGDYAEILATFGNQFLGDGEVVARVEGAGRNKAQKTGKKKFFMELSVQTGGDYKLVLGGFLLFKHGKKDVARIRFYDVLVEAGTDEHRSI